MFDWATNAINDGIRQMSNLHSTIVLMDAWAAVTPDSIDPFMANLVRVMSTLVKEHLNTAAPTPSHELHLSLLRTCFQLFKSRMAAAGDGRRWVLSSLCQLVEKSPSIELCRDILGIASHWVLEESKDPIPTFKEKSTLLGKMQVFENRPDDSLLHDFLQVILKIYSEPSLARSEYTIRLEQPFLLGCRSRDSALRCRFMDIFDTAITGTLKGRFHYILGIQQWDSLADMNWLHQASDLLLGAADKDTPLFPENGLEGPDDKSRQFHVELEQFTTGHLIGPIRRLLYADPEATHQLWVNLFRLCWSCFNRKEQLDSTRQLITLLSKDYHMQNVERRPNVIQTLLAGALSCSPPLALPAHLVRYLGKTYNAHHTAIELIAITTEDYGDEETLRDNCNDALAETFAELAEDDYLYGLWRRRAVFMETNVAVSFEQGGLWNQAQQMV